jgi:hypothetical protein
VISIPCSQEVEDVTLIPSTSSGARKKLRPEDSSILYGETTPPSLQSPIQFEITTKKFVQRLYILLGTANPGTILQTISFGKEHHITVILEDEELILSQISTSLSILKERLEKEVELFGLKNIDERSHKLLLTELHLAAHVDRWFGQVSSSRVVQNVFEFFENFLQYRRKVEVQTFESSPLAGRTERKHADIFTSSTTAIETAVSSLEVTTIFDLLRLREQSTNEKTSCVNFFISARKGDRQRIYSLETPEQPFQVTLRCWKSADLKNVSERRKYLHTYASATLHIGEGSKLHEVLNQFFLIAARECVSNGGKQWEKNN